MNILNMAYYTSKRFLTDKKVFVGKMLVPIIIMLILGNALSAAFEPQTLDLSRVGYINQDAGNIGGLIIDELSSNKEISELISLKEVSSYDEAVEQVEADKLDAFIIIDEEFTKEFKDKEKKATLEIYANQYEGYRQTVIQNVMDSFINVLNTLFVVKDLEGINAIVNGQEVAVESFNSLEAVAMSPEGKVPNALGYYAVTMLVLVLITGASLASDFIGEDYLGVIGQRIKASPIKPYEQYIGKMIGAVIANFLQGIIMVVFTRLVFDVNWGSNYLLIGLVILVASIVATSIGALICLLTRDTVRSNTILTIIIHLGTFLAGGYVKMDMDLKFLSPSYYAQTALFNTIYNNDMQIVFNNIGIMLIISIFTMVIAILLGRRNIA